MSKLAELIRSLEPFEHKRAGSLRIGVDEIRTILSALRRVEKLEAALRKIEQSAGMNGERGTTGDGHQQAIQDARQALTGEA